MKIRFIIPIAALLISGCSDDPVRPESTQDLAFTPSFALVVPLTTLMDRLADSGIDPAGRNVVGASRFAVNWWDPGQPARWSPGYGIGMLGTPDIAGITAYGDFVTNSHYVSAANVYVGTTCHAVYWRERNAQRPPAVTNPAITRHILPPAEGNGCLQIQAITEVDGTFARGEGAFTIVGSAGPHQAERAYRFDVSATDEVTVTQLPGPPATVGVDHYTRAFDVNDDAGIIVGSFFTGGTGRRVVSWSLADNAVTDWNIPGEGFAVNSSGTVVGTNIGVTNHGFVSTGPGNSTEIVVGSNGTFMTDISDQGAMIGDAHSGIISGFVIMNGMTATRPGMEFKGISKRGVIVGVSNSEFLGSAILNARRDLDDDGVADVEDNCPVRWNSDQNDVDVDGAGDYCDPDFPPVAVNLTASHTTRPEGGRFIFNYDRFFDPGEQYPVDVSWDTDLTKVGEWDFMPNNRGKRVTYTDEGEYQVTLSMTNAMSNTMEHTWTVTVTNLAPIVTIHGSNGLTAGAPTALLLNIRDPGPQDVITYTIDWDDGTAVENYECESHDACDNGLPMERTHTYASPGARKITVTAQDEDGGSRIRYHSLTVE